MGIKMKTISRGQCLLTYGDLDIGDIFRFPDGDRLFIKIENTYEYYNVEYEDETEKYNTVGLFTGNLYWFDDDHKVEKYNKEIEITVDPKQDFVSWI